MQATKILTAEQRQKRMHLINQNRQRRMAQLTRVQQHKENRHYQGGYHGGHLIDPLSGFSSSHMTPANAPYYSPDMQPSGSAFYDIKAVKSELDAEPMDASGMPSEQQVSVLQYHHQLPPSRSPGSPATVYSESTCEMPPSSMNTEDELNSSYNEKYSHAINSRVAHAEYQRHTGDAPTVGNGQNGNSESELFDIILAQMLN